MKRIYWAFLVGLLSLIFPTAASACLTSLSAFDKSATAFGNEPARVWQKAYASDLQELLSLGGKLSSGQEMAANDRLQKTLISLVKNKQAEYKNLQSSYQKEKESCLVKAAQKKKASSLKAAEKTNKDSLSKIEKEKENLDKDLQVSLDKIAKALKEDLDDTKGLYLKKKAKIKKAMNKTTSYTRALLGAKKLKKNKRVYKSNRAEIKNEYASKVAKIEKNHNEEMGDLEKNQKDLEAALSKSKKAAEEQFTKDSALAKQSARSLALKKFSSQVSLEPQRDIALVKSEARKIKDLVSRLYKRDKLETLRFSYPKNKLKVSWERVSATPTWSRAAYSIATRPRVALAGPDLAGNGAILHVGDGFAGQTKDKLVARVQRVKSVSQEKAKSNASLAGLKESLEDKHSVVIFDTGSRDLAAGDIQRNLRAVSAAVGKKRCIVVPTLYVPGNAARNEYIREFARQRLGVVLAEWAPVADQNKAFRKGDGYFQLSEKGKAKRADILKAAISDCFSGDWTKETL